MNEEVGGTRYGTTPSRAGILFAAYHIDMPWNIPSALGDMLILAYPTKRYRSAWIGMAVHGTQTVFFGVLVFVVVI
jgi:hypothetical protein